MRAVADTNTVASGLLWLGNPGRLLEWAAHGVITLYTSQALVAELREILARPKLARRIQTSGLTLDELLARYTGVARMIEPASIRRTVTRDPDDDAVLACALAARAGLIVSGDAHLLNLKSYQRISIVAAAEAVARITQASAGN